MDEQRRELIEAIHATPTMIVLVVTGGGSTAIADLLSVAGASGTILEAVVPYAHSAVEEWLGGAEGGAHARTALEMATRAHARARDLAGDTTAVCGIACTAALATVRDRRGADRAHLASVGDGATIMEHVELERCEGREAQERIVSDVVLRLVARACGVGEVQ
ncbi:MAG: hypothetical protein GY708_24345 [Actinomycetia bacterium]|nr:hypothetical protein [Actinomycetes bacterium]